MYGTQATCRRGEPMNAFENDVKMYGTQAKRAAAEETGYGLRMM